jgi:hypothetical protein
MNIFYLDKNPKKCAEYHNDKHCVKMILETAQLLSTAHRVLDGTETVGLSQSGRKKKVWQLPDDREQKLYSATHIHHPSAVWCRQSALNYSWLHSLLVALCAEYTYRYDKVHKCFATGLVHNLAYPPHNIKHDDFTGPTPAMPDDVKVENDSINSYRNYYNKHKTHLASWKKRDVPEWYKGI